MHDFLNESTVFNHLKQFTKIIYSRNLLCFQECVLVCVVFYSFFEVIKINMQFSKF